MALVILKKLSFIDLSGNDVSNDIVKYMVKSEFTCRACGDICMTYEGHCCYCFRIFCNDYALPKIGSDHFLTRVMIQHYKKSGFNSSIKLMIPIGELEIDDINTRDLSRYLGAELQRSKRKGDSFLYLYFRSSEHLMGVLDYHMMIHKYFKYVLEIDLDNRITQPWLYYKLEDSTVRDSMTSNIYPTPIWLLQ